MENHGKSEDILTKLISSSRNNDVEILKYLKSEYPYEPSSVTNADNELIENDLAKLLSQELTPNGQTSIHYAAAQGSLKYLQRIFEYFGIDTCNGTDPDLEDHDKWTPFLMAVQNGHKNVVEYFLDTEKGIGHNDFTVTKRLKQKDMGNWDALMWACYSGHEDIVQILLNKGAKVDNVVSYQMNSLIWAAGRGHHEIVKLLLTYAKQCKLDHIFQKADRFGSTALYWACRKGCLQTVNHLLDYCSNVKNNTFLLDQIGAYNMTCLIVAIKNGHTEVALRLLEDRKLNKRSSIKNSISGAQQAGHKSSVNLSSMSAPKLANLNSQTLTKTSLNQPDNDSRTALHYAAKLGMTSVVQSLLALDVHKDKQDKYGNTALILAAKHGKHRAVEALVATYCDIDLFDSRNRSALYWACERASMNYGKNFRMPGSSSKVRKNSVVPTAHEDESDEEDITSDDEDNVDYYKVIRHLLNTKADTELAHKENGDTALLRAVKNKSDEVVSLLINESNASCRVRDENGDTALHIAIRAKAKNIAELLLKDPKNEQLLYTSNNKGETPYNIDNKKEPRVLTSIFGHRSLNVDAELAGPNLKNYDLYSSSLADVLAEPTLQTPLTVGIYAQWGSGKSWIWGSKIT